MKLIIYRKIYMEETDAGDYDLNHGYDDDVPL